MTVAALLGRRPDVRLAERRLAAATAHIGVATADLYPRITLTGLYGGASPGIAELGEGRSLTWGVGPRINWTFSNQAGPRADAFISQEAAAAGRAGDIRSRPSCRR